LRRSHAQLAQCVQLASGFHSLGNDVGADFVSERNQGGGKRASFAILVDRSREAHVQLDEVGLDTQDVPHAGVAGAGIIDGYFYAQGA